MSTEKTFKGRVSNKHGTEEYWILSVYTDTTKTELRSNPFIPLAGELIIYDPDSIYTHYRVKYGDGVTNVVDLPFASGQADWEQTDETKSDFIKNKPTFLQSGSQTATSTEDGGENIYTFTASDGTTSTFVVKNGSKGAAGAQGATGKQGDQGIQGEPGAPGYTPVRGTDYWTAADKAEIKAYVDEAILNGAW